MVEYARQVTPLSLGLQTRHVCRQFLTYSDSLAAPGLLLLGYEGKTSSAVDAADAGDNRRDMTVSQQQLEASLDKIRARTRDVRHGMYGPSSMVWRVNREQLLLLSGARAVLLQEAHPFVAHGVDQHSLTKQDPIGRYVRTFKHVHAMVFGDLESAMTAARRVHKYHTTIHGKLSEAAGAYAKGARYEANDERALLWVHATIWDSSVMAYELMFEPLSNEDKERYYQETKLFAYMFGIPDEIIPPNWPEFVEYNQRMWASNELGVEGTARSMAEFILSPENHFHARFAAPLRAITAGLLTPRFREAYGLSYGARERAMYRGSLLAIKASRHLIAPNRRFVPAYIAARTRIGQPIVPSFSERLLARCFPPSLAKAALPYEAE